MFRPSVFLLILVASISVIHSADSKKDENQSLSEILKLVNENPGVEIRVEFEGGEEVTSAGDKKPKIPAEDTTGALLLAKELNQTSTNILEKLNTTASKLEAILERLANFEKLSQEVPKTKDQKHSAPQHQIKASNQTDSVEEHDNVTDLLLA